MRILYRIGADTIWVAHFFIVGLVLFGWMFPSLWYLYIAALVGTLTSLLLLNYCFLSKWEFDLRKKLNPKLEYEFSYASYYTYRLTQGRLSPRFLSRAGMLFVAVSLLINLYFFLTN